MPADPEIMRTLGSIEGKLDATLLSLADLKNDLHAHEVQDHEDFKVVHGRINKEAKKINFILGGVAVFSTLVGAAAAFFKDLLTT